MTVDMGTIWDRTTRFLGDNLRAWLPVLLLAIFIPQTVSDILQLASASVGQATAQVAGLLLALVGLWGQLFVVALALDPGAGAAAARATATGGLVRALIVMLALFVVAIVLLAPLGVVLAMGGVDLTQLNGQTQQLSPDLSTGARLFLGLYFLALLIVALFVTARLVPLYPVVLGERLSLGAIGRSFAVTRGMTWKLIGVLLLFVVVFAVAAVAARSVIGVIVGLIAPADGTLTPAAVVSAILGALVTALFTLVIAVFSTQVYRAVVPGRAAVVDAA